MARFFVSPEQIKDGRVYITGSDVNHIVRVLRLGAGERITALDGCGRAYDAVIEKTGKNEVICVVEKDRPAGGAPPLRITLVQGIPKGEKMDFIVQKSTELGVGRVIPLVCERSVVKLEGDKSGKRQERWQRIALEAAKQSRRPEVPEIGMPSGWGPVLESLPEGALALLPWEEENAVSLKEVLRGEPTKADIYIFIGPEGGFSPGEVERVRGRGVLPVTLGPRILRTETAGLAVLTMLLYQWGDLGGKADE